MTELPTAQLGLTGIEITRLGIGSWAIGGGDWDGGWGPQDDKESVAAIRHAVEAGLNWVDTAAIYGLGHSEEVVAAALSVFSDDDRPYVFTKGSEDFGTGHGKPPYRRAGESASIRAQVENSLRRLDRDRIDLYQLHWPADDGTPVEAYWATLLELQSEGKIGAAGLSNHGLDLLARAEAVGHVASLQPPLSLLERSALNDIIPWCRVHDTGVIVYSPMQSGLLTGSFTPERAASLSQSDWRSRSANFQSPKLEANLALVDSLRPIASRHATSVASVAIAWTLSFPGVTGAIVGVRRPEQVDAWIDGATLELDAEDISNVIDAIERTGAGIGPTVVSSVP